MTNVTRVAISSVLHVIQTTNMHIEVNVFTTQSPGITIPFVDVLLGYRHYRPNESADFYYPLIGSYLLSNGNVRTLDQDGLPPRCPDLLPTIQAWGRCI